ncbi:MAG: ATP-binding protein [Dehalococcoidia bacterium]|nr:ATP-binding protein [Dehalococcoidia bacterium]
MPARLTVTGREQDLPVTTKQKLFYAAHNALTNALQHARPTQVALELAYQGETLNLRVGDDGIGFETNRARSLEGQGLRNMRYIVEEELGGTFEVSSSLGNGTTVTVTVSVGEA